MDYCLPILLAIEVSKSCHFSKASLDVVGNEEVRFTVLDFVELLDIPGGVLASVAILI